MDFHVISIIFIKYKDSQLQTDMVTLDFSNAFNTVSHEKLLYKLRFYGIKGNILDWISVLLT